MTEEIKLVVSVEDKGAVSKLKKISSGFDSLKKTTKGAHEAIMKRSEESKKVLDLMSKGFLAVGAAIGVATVALVSMANQQAKTEKMEKVFKGAPEVLARIRKHANDTGVAFEDANEVISQLGRNFSPKNAEVVFKTMTDLSAVAGLTPDKFKALGDEFAELGNKASVNAGDFEKFQKIVGGNVLSVEKLAKVTGKSVKETQAALDKGTISSVEFFKALSSDQQAGSKAIEAASSSISAQITRFGSIVDTIKERLFTAIFGDTASAAKGLKSINDTLDEMFSSGNISKFVTEMKNIYKLLEDLSPIIITFAGAITAMMLPALYAYVAEAAIAAAATWAMLGPWAIAGAALTALGLIVYKVYKNWSGITDFFKESFTTLMSFLGGLKDSFLNIGSDIISGLVNGLIAGKDFLINTVTDLAKGVGDTFKEVLGINSPSKLFAQYGEYTGEGYAIGIQKSQGGVNKATQNMATKSNDEHKKKIQALSNSSASSTNTGNMLGSSTTVNNDNSSKTSNTPIQVHVHIENGNDVNVEKVKESAQAVGNALLDALTRASYNSAGY
jgi:hypothetical protein